MTLRRAAISVSLLEMTAAITTSEIFLIAMGIIFTVPYLFVCIAGIELDLKRVWRHRAESATAAALALGVPLLPGSIAALALLRYPGRLRRAREHIFKAA